MNSAVYLIYASFGKQMNRMDEDLRTDLQNLFEGNIPCRYFQDKVLQRCP